ncbi:MAG TPA: MauE/DoxX family redox-associated membrane protein [Streptosporangiaceae bacterium]|nr:MauE/DoxX family redox-associated membrane protein [Streptosporangiaceae bacterium]
MLLTALGQAQIPLLAAMLLGGCAAKFARGIRRRSIDAGLGPTALFPLRLRPVAAATLSAIELAMGIGLIVTAGSLGGTPAATLIRIGTCLLFVVATLALVELRNIRPDIGCGCFGEFSSTPITGRTLTRSILLAAAALGTVSVKPIRPHGLANDWVQVLAILAIELVIIAALSPEVRELLVRIGYSAPCELRMPTTDHTLSALRRSSQWRRHLALLAADEPQDVWRELCWRYMSFPSRYNGREADLVFAIYLQNRRPVVLSVLVDAMTGAVIPWPVSSGRPVGWRWARLLRRGTHAAPQPELPAWLGERPAPGRLAGQAHTTALSQEHPTLMSSRAS